MSLVLPKVITSTQNTDLIMVDEWSPPARGTLYLMFKLWKYLHFHRGSTRCAVWVFSKRTHGRRESCTHKHKCYCSRGSAGLLVVRMVCVQLAASRGASHALFTYCSPVGWADCERRIHACSSIKKPARFEFMLGVVVVKLPEHSRKELTQFRVLPVWITVMIVWNVLLQLFMLHKP